MWLTVIAEYSLQVQVLLWTRRVRRVFWLWTTHCEPFVLDSVKLQSLAARASACIQAPLRSSQSSECSRQMAHASPLMRQVGGSLLCVLLGVKFQLCGPAGITAEQAVMVWACVAKRR